MFQPMLLFARLLRRERRAGQGVVSVAFGSMLSIKNRAKSEIGAKTTAAPA